MTEKISASVSAHQERVGMYGRIERATNSWSLEQLADLAAMIECGQLTPDLLRDALDPGIGVLMVMP